jgi:hypothetical protein
MSQYYANLHSTNIKKAKDDGEEFEDTITWEPACPDGILNKFESISNCQLKRDNTIHGINYWKIESAYSWFIANHHNFDPVTTIPVKAGLFKRILLQKRLCELVEGYEQLFFIKENIDNINMLLITNFNRYIVNKNSLTEKELVILKSFLHIGDTKGFLTDYTDENDMKITGNAIRDMAIERINAAENGSWLLRETSIVSSDFIKAYCITYKDTDGNISHVPIAHAAGFGYIVPDVARGTVMPNKDSKAKFPKYVGPIHASFIDLLDHLAHHNRFVISKVLRVD